ncbi:hypothetical protein CCACVL1_23420 [Corchorus capsularis]|uniref:Uncharacterized protein n=1 Tax=Corchorus capsularis TaxID=210143 RepID=A0A1R3GTU5_COCAP|nr:hypothetical protein CCACVL1_23420 [Corchorus capsularis]
MESNAAERAGAKKDIATVGSGGDKKKPEKPVVVRPVSVGSSCSNISTSPAKNGSPEESKKMKNQDRVRFRVSAKRSLLSDLNLLAGGSENGGSKKDITTVGRGGDMNKPVDRADVDLHGRVASFTSPTKNGSPEETKKPPNSNARKSSILDSILGKVSEAAGDKDITTVGSGGDMNAASDVDHYGRVASITSSHVKTGSPQETKRRSRKTGFSSRSTEEVDQYCGSGTAEKKKHIVDYYDDLHFKLRSFLESPPHYPNLDKPKGNLNCKPEAEVQFIKAIFWGRGVYGFVMSEEGKRIIKGLLRWLVAQIEVRRKIVSNFTLANVHFNAKGEVNIVGVETRSLNAEELGEKKMIEIYQDPLDCILSLIVEMCKGDFASIPLDLAHLMLYLKDCSVFWKAKKFILNHPFFWDDMKLYRVIYSLDNLSKDNSHVMELLQRGISPGFKWKHILWSRFLNNDGVEKSVKNVRGVEDFKGKVKTAYYYGSDGRSSLYTDNGSGFNKFVRNLLQHYKKPALDDDGNPMKNNLYTGEVMVLLNMLYPSFIPHLVSVLSSEEVFQSVLFESGG